MTYKWPLMYEVTAGLVAMKLPGNISDAAVVVKLRRDYGKSERIAGLHGYIVLKAIVAV